MQGINENNEIAVITFSERMDKHVKISDYNCAMRFVVKSLENAFNWSE